MRGFTRVFLAAFGTDETESWRVDADVGSNTGAASDGKALGEPSSEPGTSSPTKFEATGSSLDRDDTSGSPGMSMPTEVEGVERSLDCDDTADGPGDRGEAVVLFFIEQNMAFRLPFLGTISPAAENK